MRDTIPAPMPTEILSTKLVPPEPRTDFVSRLRLIHRIANPKRGRVTLIAAPAGYGKTMLLAEWCFRQKTPMTAQATLVVPQKSQVARQETSSAVHRTQIAWLALDTTDNDPALFWRYVAASLHQDLAPGQPVDANTILNLVAQSPLRTVLILDDFQLIHTKNILEGVALLVDRAPHTLSVVIASRTLPDLPLARWRARGQLDEIRTQQLAFTSGEMRAFLQTTMGLELDADTLAKLEEKTEGWAAGLQLAALSMKAQSNPFNAPSAPAYIFDYLAAEVLRGQSRARQTFLLQTSVLDHFNPDLANAVTGQKNSAAVLRRLVEANLFLVPLDAGQTWYRYHPLFAEFLYDRLVETDSAREKLLHRRAAKWFAAHRLLPEAIAHAMRAGAFDRAGLWIDRACDEAMQYGQVATILQWLEGLPREIAASSPSLELWYGWVLCIEGRFDEMENHLRNAEKRSSRLARQDGRRKFEMDLVPGKCAAVRARAAAMQEDTPGVLRWSARALKTLPKQIRNERSVAWRTRAETLERIGKWDEADAAFTQAEHDSRASSHPFIHVGVLVSHARMWMRRGEPEVSKPLLKQAIDFARANNAEAMAAPAAQLLRELVAPARKPNPPERLSTREREILDWIARGESNPHIARHLGIGVGTVNWHTKNIYKKLGVRNRTQAAALAGKE